MTKPPRVGICLGRSKAYLCLKFLGRSRPRLIHFLKIRPQKQDNHVAAIAAILPVMCQHLLSPYQSHVNNCCHIASHVSSCQPRVNNCRHLASHMPTFTAILPVTCQQLLSSCLSHMYKCRHLVIHMSTITAILPVMCQQLLSSCQSHVNN